MSSPKKHHNYRDPPRCTNCWSIRHKLAQCPSPYLPATDREALRLDLGLPSPNYAAYFKVLQSSKLCTNCWADDDHRRVDCKNCPKWNMAKREKVRVLMGVEANDNWRMMLLKEGVKEIMWERRFVGGRIDIVQETKEKMAEKKQKKKDVVEGEQKGDEPAVQIRKEEKNRVAQVKKEDENRAVGVKKNEDVELKPVDNCSFENAPAQSSRPEAVKLGQNAEGKEGIKPEDIRNFYVSNLELLRGIYPMDQESSYDLAPNKPVTTEQAKTVQENNSNQPNWMETADESYVECEDGEDDDEILTFKLTIPDDTPAPFKLGSIEQNPHQFIFNPFSAHHEHNLADPTDKSRTIKKDHSGTRKEVDDYLAKFEEQISGIQSGMHDLNSNLGLNLATISSSLTEVLNIMKEKN